MTGRAHALDRVPGLREIAQAQLGVVRRDQLRALGVSHHHVRRQLEAERWQCIGPHAVVLQSGSLSRGQWLVLGPVHAGPGSELDLWSALERAGLRGWERRPVYVAAPRGRRAVRLPGVAVRQVGHLEPTTTQHGYAFACAPTARAAIEAASLERSDTSAAGLLLAVAQQRICSPVAMRQELDRLWRPRRAALIRSVLADAGAGAESVAEVDVVPLIVRAGLPAPRRQVEVSTSEGVLRLDVLIELRDGRLLNVEVDGPHHQDPLQRARDAARDAALIALGYIVLRIPSTEVRLAPEGVVRRLRLIAQASRAS